MPRRSKDLDKLLDMIKPPSPKVPTSAREFACGECACALVMGPEGFPMCSSARCGLMVTAVLDRTPEWRFAGGQGCGGNPTRCGMPINPLLRESSYGLRVLITSNSSYQMRKIGRYTGWIGMPYKEKAHYDEFQRIKLLADTGGLPKMIIQDAMRFHKMVSERKTFRGLNRDGIIAASVYISARVNGYPRTPKEIARVFVLDPTAATKGCKNAMSIFNTIEQDLDEADKTKMWLSTPDSFIPRYCSKLGLSEELLMLCKFIAQRIKQKDIVPENTPHAKAAGIIYFVVTSCNVEITKKQIAEVSEISEVTINKCYRKLTEHKGLLLPKQFADKYQRD
jgi:transcription initiation factor TFIIB